MLLKDQLPEAHVLCQPSFAGLSKAPLARILVLDYLAGIRECAAVIATAR